MNDTKDEVFNSLDGLRVSHSMNNMDNVVKYLEAAFNIDKQTARQYLSDWMRDRKGK